MKCIPLITHFSIVKLGFAVVCLIFLCLIQNIDCGYSLELPWRVPTIHVLSKNISSENFHICLYNQKLYGCVFVMLKLQDAKFIRISVLWNKQTKQQLLTMSRTLE